MSTLEEVEDEAKNRSSGPLLGAVATRDNLDEIEQLCLQALRRDWTVLVVCPEDTVGALPDVTDASDVTVVTTSSEHAGFNSRGVSSFVEQLSPSRSVFVEDTSTPVAFDQQGDTSETRDALDNQAAELDTQTVVVIPAYNEEETIRDVARTAMKHTDDVVVVDDGSEDDTIREAWRADADIVAHTQNRGYGSALRTAFDVAAKRDTDTLVVLDGDGQHDPADIPKLVETVEDGAANVVIGSRFVGESSGDIPLYRRVGLFTINVLTNVSLGNFAQDSWIHDTQSGYRAYDREAIDHFSSEQALGDDMGASLDILYRVSERGLTIEEYPVVVEYDVPSGNSQNPITHGLGLVATILRTTVRRHTVSVLVAYLIVLMTFLSVSYLAFTGSV